MLFNKTLAGFLSLASLGATYQHEDLADRALKLGAREVCRHWHYFTSTDTYHYLQGS
jgi:hypothetical protein